MKLYLSFLVMLLSLCAFSCMRENPKDRNYLFFNEHKKDEIIDSLVSLKELISTLDFPVSLGKVWFQFYNENLIISKNEIGKLTYNNLRSNRHLKNINDIDLKRFISIFIFLHNCGISSPSYDKDLKIIDYQYKHYYYMYSTLSYDDDLIRFLKLVENIDDIDLEHFKILDSYKNVYLLAFKDSQIWESNVLYKNKYKVKLNQ